jgi:hypothetical protein
MIGKPLRAACALHNAIWSSVDFSFCRSVENRA